MKGLLPAWLALLWTLQPVPASEVWTVERAVDHALAHSPDARIARYRIAAARAQLGQANSAFWPKLQLQSGYTRTDTPMLSFGNILNQRRFSSSVDFNDVPETDNVAVRGLVTTTIYAGGRNRASRDEANAGSKAARLDELAVRDQLQFEVVRAFHTILKTREFARSVEASVRSLEKNLEIARRREGAGTLLKADVLDFEVRLAEAREQLVRAINANSLAQRALQNVLGLESSPEFAIAETAPLPSLPGAPAKERPELIALQHRQEAALAKIRGAKAGYKPRVSAFGNLDYDYGPVTHGDGGSYAVGVVAQWDLWDGLSTRSKIQETEAELESLREEERKVRLAIQLEIEQAQLNLAAADERLLATASAIAQAADSLALTRNRFDQGLALPMQVIDAETALLAARVRRAEAESDKAIAVAALRRAFALPQFDPP